MQNAFYDTYWAEGHKHTGSRQGYAPNFIRWIESEFSENSKNNNNHRILEAGCGDASFTPFLSSHFRETHAIDISSTQIETNKALHKNINFRAHDLSQQLPFPDKYFDAIWCSEVLEHLFDPYYALQEFRRVLQPNGKLLVTVPYHGGLKSILIAIFKWDHHFDPEYPHIRFFTIKSLAKISQKAGFQTLLFKTCGMSKPFRDLFIPTNILMKAS